MRLTILNQFYKPDISPTAELTASLAEHRARRGDRVTVVAGRGGYVPGVRSRREVDNDGLRVHRLWTPGLGKRTLVHRLVDYAAFYIGAFLRLLTLPPQDVIVSLTTPPYIMLAAIAHKMLHPRSRIVLWCMDCYPDVAERAGVIRRGRWVSRMLRRLNRFCFRWLDRVVGLDRPMVDRLLSQYAPEGRGVPATVIPNWEPVSLFPSGLAELPRGGPNGLVPADHFVVLYLGNAGYAHEFDTILDAAEQLKGQPITFLFVGGGSRRESIAEEKRRRDLDNLVLHGYVALKQETIPILSAADCALICLREDFLGLCSPSKLHGQLAMGLPVLYVGPANSNVDAAIEAYQCGVSLRPGDVEGIVRFITRLASRDEDRQELGRRARSAFEQSYCDQQTLPRFDRLLEEVGGVDV